MPVVVGVRACITVANAIASKSSWIDFQCVYTQCWSFDLDDIFKLVCCSFTAL